MFTLPGMADIYQGAKALLFVSGQQLNNGPTTHKYFPHCNILRSSMRASSRRQKVSGSRAGVSSWVRAVRDVGGEDTFN